MVATQRERRFFVPEVIQTSGMDCGPASLKALLEGFGIATSYGRLREACQTTVDGTSIDTLEDLAVQLGLEAEQIMLPADHLLLEEAQALPAIVVVRLPSGLTHFVVVWSWHGNWVQVMDPGGGRRWKPCRRFLDELFIHHFPVSAQAWRDWAGTSGFLAPLRRRLLDLRISEQEAVRLIDLALADSGWHSLAGLDAATRLVAALVHSGALDAGEGAGRVIARSYEGNRGVQPAPGAFPIPSPYWSVTPLAAEREDARVTPPGQSPDEASEEQLLLRGAVLVRVTGRRAAAQVSPAGDEAGGVPVPLSPELAAVLQETPAQPLCEVWRALRQDGLLTPAVLAVALGMATLGVTIQALLLQGLLRIGQSLNLGEQRIAAVAVLFVLIIALFLIELPVAATALRIGRRLETRLRIAFLEKIPRLGDRYFHSRLTSDMTQRAHDLRQLRLLPNLGVELLRLVFQLLLTTVGVIWLQPQSAALAIFAALAFMGLSLVATPILEERDLRLRSHTGALSRFYLDAMLGLIPLRTHGAERAFRREHESLLVEWARAGFDFSRVAVLLQGVSALLYSGFAIWIVFDYIGQGGETGGVLLLFYWTLNLPVLGQSLVQSVQQYPMLRNRVLRILELLGAPDEVTETEAFKSVPLPQGLEEGPGLALSEACSERSREVEGVGAGVSIEMQDVSVQAGGHTILTDINFSLKAGDHLAIVGPSGAGKTSLVSILLGWHRPVSGQCLVDGEPLRGSSLRQLRRQTAWVDPAVQVWNRTLFENLTYGNDQVDGSAGLLIEEADLFEVIERLENGLQTVLGEGGGLVSGGEGQRVRLGRAMNRPGVRLVILDEPFRGLDRGQRRALLKKARQFWRDATLICVTHDVGETQAFERVLVMEEGQIVEDAAPADLATRPGSRYRAMLEAEEAVRAGLWESADWRRLWIEEGRLTERNG